MTEGVRKIFAMVVQEHWRIQVYWKKDAGDANCRTSVRSSSIFVQWMATLRHIIYLLCGVYGDSRNCLIKLISSRAIENCVGPQETPTHSFGQMRAVSSNEKFWSDGIHLKVATASMWCLTTPIGGAVTCDVSNPSFIAPFPFCTSSLTAPRKSSTDFVSLWKYSKLKGRCNITYCTSKSVDCLKCFIKNYLTVVQVASDRPGCICGVKVLSGTEKGIISGQ